jgi:hypothetical protein
MSWASELTIRMFDPVSNGRQPSHAPSVRNATVGCPATSAWTSIHVLTKSLPSATHLHRGDSRESGRDTALGLEQRLPLNRINHDVAGLPISVRTHCGPWRRRLEPDLLKPTDRLAGR